MMKGNNIFFGFINTGKFLKGLIFNTEVIQEIPIIH